MTGAMTPARIRHEACAFMIWREGSSVNWDCTIPELAEATKLNRKTVGRICWERKWPVEGLSARPARENEPTDDYMRRIH